MTTSGLPTSRCASVLISENTAVVPIDSSSECYLIGSLEIFRIHIACFGNSSWLTAGPGITFGEDKGKLFLFKVKTRKLLVKSLYNASI